MLIEKQTCQHDILIRLKKIEGQIRGISRMIEEERNCRDVIVQLTAVKAAIAQVGVAVLRNHLVFCIDEDSLEDKKLLAHLEEFTDLLKKWC